MLTTQPLSSVTFAVDDVAPATAPLSTCKVLEAVESLVNAPADRFGVETLAPGDPAHGRVEACWQSRMHCVSGIRHHPLMAATHLAFSDHRPLVLSPDVIWVTIAQGLAQHVRLNPEAYRALLVRHEGKRALTVRRDDLYRGSPENPWDEVVADFTDQVRQEIGEFADRFVCDFSTSGPVERTVSQVVLLDALQPYFSYNVVCICGIPSVTLEGTPADWRNLRDKVELLAPFGLDWWLSELRPICDQFARAAAGDVDRDHWRRLYKIRSVYGATKINGWLAKLFPYTEEYDTGSYSARNSLLDPKVDAEIRAWEASGSDPDEGAGFGSDVPGIRADELPRGLSQVPFRLEEKGGERAMELLAGAMVVTQDRETLALRPTLGWAVRESAPIELAMMRIAKHQTEPAQGGLSEKALRGIGTRYVPTDVLRFYRDVDRAVIHESDGSPIFRFVPLSEWTEPEWAQRRRDLSEGRPVREPEGLFCFAELNDGTELVIQLEAGEEGTTDGVFVGRRAGATVSDSGRQVARSFTEFLLQALDGGSEPYFRRAGFVPLAQWAFTDI